MHHHTQLFWLAGVIVAILAAILLLRLGFKRRSLSRAQQAKIDAGVPLPEVKDPNSPGPQKLDR
ncbi:hypothetical protein [Phenylobacterium sp.]|jgi:hypothetical protein|uniref:hypothetical protein n=1 Tax=Phenylobacterium sp. TaxID=1871053 RepID=UPI002F3FC88B